MTGADSSHAARQNLAALLNELRKNVGALVIDEVHLLNAELANFLFAKILALAAARTARPTTGTSGATFTTTAATRSTFTAGAGVRVSTLATRGSAAFGAVRGSGWGD
jgi:hypothetical protein